MGRKKEGKKQLGMENQWSSYASSIARCARLRIPIKVKIP